VRVNLRGSSATFLPGFVGASNVLVQTSAAAAARPNASPTPNTLLIPIGIDQADYVAHAQVDLFQPSRRAVLDLRSAGASDAGEMSANMQWWSDGQHSTGSVAVSQNLPVVSGAYNASLAAGLADNVRRQNLRDAGGALYGLFSVPMYSGGGSPVRIVGFGRLKIRAADISASSTRGLFVPYAAGPYGTPSLASPDFGAALVGIIS
jgi:hypothetical protein